MKRTMHFVMVFVALTAMTTMMVMAQQGQGQRNQDAYKPKLYVNLPDWCHNPDGMTVCDETGMIYLNGPNFNMMKDGKKEFAATLSCIDKDGKFEKLLEYPPLAETGQCGPMGLDFGPDGNLYVCDNQYFHDKDHKSRILCVEMKNGKPTGKITPVVEGVKLANAILWYNNEMWVTDSYLDLPGAFGIGGVWRFKGDEILKQTKPLKVLPNGEDKHLVVKEKVKKIGREDTTGADGMTVDKNGVIYFGNFGEFKDQFIKAALNVPGSGWAILGYNPYFRRLEVLQAEKHEDLTQWGIIPILVCDVWEHAYYLKYQNNREEFINAWCQLINWAEAERRLIYAIQTKIGLDMPF